MSASEAPARSRKKLILAAGIGIVLAVALLMPVVVYGGFMVHVSRITFNETTGSLSATNAQASVETMTAYEYMFSVKTGGMIRTSDSNTSSSMGVANITMKLKLTNPSGQTLDVGHVNISGAMGTRSHTIYLGADEGVRLPGNYHLEIVITASVAPVGGLLQLNLTTTVTADFTIS